MLYLKGSYPCRECRVRSCPLNKILPFRLEAAIYLVDEEHEKGHTGMKLVKRIRKSSCQGDVIFGDDSTSGYIYWPLD